MDVRDTYVHMIQVIIIIIIITCNIGVHDLPDMFAFWLGYTNQANLSCPCYDY